MHQRRKQSDLKRNISGFTRACRFKEPRILLQSFLNEIDIQLYPGWWQKINFKEENIKYFKDNSFAFSYENGSGVKNYQVQMMDHLQLFDFPLKTKI